MSTSFTPGIVTPFRAKLGIIRSVELTPDKDSASMNAARVDDYASVAMRYASPATPKRSHAETFARSPPGTPKRSKTDQRLVSSSLDSGLARLLSSSNATAYGDVTPRRQSWRRCREYDKTPHAPRKEKKPVQPLSEDSSPLKPKALFQEQETLKPVQDITIQLISSMTALVGFLCTFVASSMNYDGATEVNVSLFVKYLSGNSANFRSEHMCVEVLLRICELFPAFAKFINGRTRLLIHDREAANVLSNLRKMRVSQILGSSHRYTSSGDLNYNLSR